MLYEVNINSDVDFAPDSEVAEILQNVRTIISTRKGTVPLDRDFGLTWEHIDKPLPVARALQRAAVVDAIEEYEPRAKVRAVYFDETETDVMHGISQPRVIVSIGDEKEEDIYHG